MFLLIFAKQRQKIYGADFNTSHVSINHTQGNKINKNLNYFNTSHVSINLACVSLI